MQADAQTDGAWEALLEQLDLEGTDDPAVLAAAEAELSAIGHVPAAASPAVERVLATIQAEHRAAPVLALRPRRSAWRAVAAALLATALLVAAVNRVVVWFARHDPDQTMSFAEAIEILNREDQDAVAQRAAIGRVLRGAVQHAVDAVLSVRAETDAPEALRDFATVRAEDLRRALEVGAGIGLTPVEDAKPLAARAKDPTASASERAWCLDRLVGVAVTSVQAIYQLRASDPAVDRDRRAGLRSLRQAASLLR